MYTQVTESIFKDAFRHANRAENFSYEALALLFEYFDQDNGTDQELELDVIAICCDFPEQDQDDLRDQYNISEDDVIDYLDEHTVVVGRTSGGAIVFQNF
jgi:hypothetical protein